MNESEFEAMLTEKVRSSVLGGGLPVGMEERLVGSIRRTRRIFRAKVMALVTVIAVMCILVLGFMGREEKTNVGETSLIAAQQNGEEKSEVGAWVFLGAAFRECFKTNKTNKKKEEEECPQK